MGVYEKLLAIQVELKATKSQFNSFGKYYYRSCEDILEAVKPLLKKNNATLKLSDEVEMVGDRIYIRAVATFIDIDTGEQVINSALAREAAVRKGSDDSQNTGTASSYARKYCLSGLLLIDDNKDSDSDEFELEKNRKAGETKEETAKNMKLTEDIGNMKIAPVKVTALRKRIQALNVNEQKLCENNKVEKLEDLTEALFRKINEQLEKAEKASK